jgi:bacterioferritin-associated ferredoxin
VIALAIEADDEHGASMAIATGLVRREDGFISSFGSDIPDAFSKTAVAEFISTAKELDRVVGIVGSECGLHGAMVLITKRKNVRPHAQ